jgi:ribosomal protein RSM22 (predicted rRNA methylase)
VADERAAGWRGLLEHLRAHGLACTSILDVGAHRGAWARAAKAVFPSAACFLIEPQPALRPALDAFVREVPGSRYALAAAGRIGRLRAPSVHRTV